MTREAIDNRGRFDYNVLECFLELRYFGCSVLIAQSRLRIYPLSSVTPFSMGCFLCQKLQKTSDYHLHFTCERDTIIHVDYLNTPEEVNSLPNIKSAMKRVTVTEHKTLRNKMVKSATKTAVKKFDTAVASKTATAEMLSTAASVVDKAAAKGVISKNAANRQKARMARVLAKAE